MNASTITDWLMVIITAIYVAATICIMLANQSSAKATKMQVDEMKRQFEENNQPYITTELIYEKRSFFGLRFTNHGAKIAEHVTIDFDPQFVACLKESFKKLIEEQKGKECVIGIGQHYDIFFGKNDIRGQEDLMPAKGVIKFKSGNKEYQNAFEIGLNNYMTIFSVNTEEEDIRNELRAQNDKLEKLNTTLLRLAAQIKNNEENDESIQ
ncbi:MAG: hypothetical protein IJ214_08100 [Clostridia bacterium]|nr:hypothetical protein [Clostridia bacterium]